MLDHDRKLVATFLLADFHGSYVQADPPDTLLSRKEPDRYKMIRYCVL